MKTFRLFETISAVSVSERHFGTLDAIASDEVDREKSYRETLARSRLTGAIEQRYRAIGACYRAAPGASEALSKFK